MIKKDGGEKHDQCISSPAGSNIYFVMKIPT